MLVAGAAVIYAVIFISLNRTKVHIHFVFFSVSSRLWVGFLVCLALGALLGQAVGVYRRRRATRTDSVAGRGRNPGGGATPTSP
jgi:uncharacterized integral membrane protein